MFWFDRNMFSGSNLFFTATSRSLHFDRGSGWSNPPEPCVLVQRGRSKAAENRDRRRSSHDVGQPARMSVVRARRQHVPFDALHKVGKGCRLLREAAREESQGIIGLSWGGAPFLPGRRRRDDDFPYPLASVRPSSFIPIESWRTLLNGAAKIGKPVALRTVLGENASKPQRFVVWMRKDAQEAERITLR